jgi:AraC-like DNA-binding protein
VAPVTECVAGELLRAEGSGVCGPLQHGDLIDEHVHELGQLRYAASGALVTVTGAGTWVTPTNRISWIPPLSAHRGSSYGRTEVRLIGLSPDLTAQLPAEPSVFVASDLVQAAFLAVTDEVDEVDERRTRRLLEVVVGELARAPRERLRLPEPTTDRLRAVTDVLVDDPATPATLAELGRRTGSSERTLSRLFRTELSMSFHQWRTLLRVQRAVLELGAGTSVTDTGLRLGWANPSSFIEAFAELVGQTPGRYRAAAYRG